MKEHGKKATFLDKKVLKAVIKPKAYDRTIKNEHVFSLAIFGQGRHQAKNMMIFD